MTAPSPASLDRIFAALSDATRRTILARLAEGETSVTELTGRLGISQPLVSKHLKVLETAGLVSRGREARFRPCRLEPAPLKRAAAWLGGYEQFWSDAFDRLEAYTRALAAEEAATRPARSPQRKRHAPPTAPRNPRPRRRP